MIEIKTNDGHVEIEVEGYSLNIVAEMLLSMRAFTQYLRAYDEDIAEFWLKELKSKGVEVCEKSDAELKEEIEKVVGKCENDNIVYPRHLRNRRN